MYPKPAPTHTSHSFEYVRGSLRIAPGPDTCKNSISKTTPSDPRLLSFYAAQGGFELLILQPLKGEENKCALLQ